jgi:hypothetical protein
MKAAITGDGIARLRNVLDRMDRWRGESGGDETEGYIDMLVELSDIVAATLDVSDEERKPLLSNAEDRAPLPDEEADYDPTYDPRD